MASKHAYPQDMQDALDKFDREAEHIIAAFVENLKSQQPPPVIYHYTDDVGLRGILGTGRLWLTDIFSLNDPSELSHGLSHVISALNSMVANGSPESKLFAKQLTAFAEQKGIQGSAYFFVCSFSSCGDDLGQWRAYADNGRGYALGFDATVLENEFTNGMQPPDIDAYAAAFSVSYTDAKLVETDRRIIERMLGLISLPRGRNLEESVVRSYMGDLMVCLMVHTTHAALFFKHKAYDNEKEYRFLQTYSVAAPPSGMKLRSRPYSLIRYKEFDWRSPAPRSLRQIVVGPAAEHKAYQFARDCVLLYHREEVPITPSAIPYRAG